MLVVGFLLLAIGLGLLALHQYRRGELRQLTSAQRSTTRELAALAESVSQALVEAGNYSQIAEVTGTIRCDQPLTSEIAKQPCVYYDARVWREYEEGRHRSRQQSSRARRGSERVSSNSQRVPFWVEDAAGRILVDPTGAEIEPVQIADRFESAETAGGSGSLKIGSFSITISGLPVGRDSGRRTLGYRFRERALPIGRRVYVLGEASDATGQLTIQKPPQKGRFLISLRSKDEVVRSAMTRARLLVVSGAGTGGAGVLIVVLSLLHVL